MYRYFYNNEKSNIFFREFLIFLLSFVIHIFILGLMCKNLKEKNIEFRETIISEVEFYQVKKVHPSLDVKKDNIERQKTVNRIKKTSSGKIKKEKILNKERNIEKKIIKQSIPNKNKIEKKKEDKPKILIKDLEFDKKIIDKIDKPKEKIKENVVELKEKEYRLNNEDITNLMMLEEVGNKKVSQKTLDIINDLEKNVRVVDIIKAKDLENINLYKDKKIDKLDKEIMNIDVDVDVNISIDKKTIYDKGLDIDIEFDKKDLKKSNFEQKDIQFLEDKKDLYKVSSYEEDLRPIKIVEKQNIKDIKNIEKPRLIEINERPKIIKNAAKDLKIDKKDSNVYEISGNVKNRKIIFSKIPKYPVWAEEQEIEAVICIFFEVDKFGNVIENNIRIDITSGYKKLDDYAISCLKAWKFSQINSNEKQSGIIKFIFKLK